MKFPTQYNIQNKIEAPFGLYVHIPFCSFSCHYCDFAKTSNFSKDWTNKYFETLKKEISSWNQSLQNPEFSTVFFGGGTPGLFTTELSDFLKNIRLRKDAEISLEVNPKNCNLDSLKHWRDSGFNRISIGVQTLDPAGLKFLTRDHGVKEIEQAVANARSVFENVNIDFIYGWPNQTLKSFQDDLAFALRSGVNHLSLYTLTYEVRTPIGRMQDRGLIKVEDDAKLESLYLDACAALKADGWEHEEVSNWSKPGFSCNHNWLYWKAQPYLGIGAGAHSFLPSKELKEGIRFSNTRDFRTYIRKFEEQQSYIVEDDRNLETFVLEYISGHIRTNRGIDLKKLMQISGKKFLPTPIISEGIARGLLTLRESNLRMTESELFRENAWIIELNNSLSEQS